MLQAKHYSVGYEHRKGIKDTKGAKHPVNFLLPVNFS